MSDDHTSNSAVPATGIASLEAVPAGRAYDLSQASVCRKSESLVGHPISLQRGRVFWKVNSAVGFILYGITLLLTAHPFATFNPQHATRNIFASLRFAGGFFRTLLHPVTRSSWSDKRGISI